MECARNPFLNLTKGPQIVEGSFGTVHMSHWLFTPVAVKTVKIRRMKLVQVNVLRRIRYPNKVLFVAHSFNNNAFHIVSEHTQCSNVTVY